MNNFYVYEWIRLDTNEPFYVGKGAGKRSDILGRRNKYFKNIVGKVGVENIAVSILHENLSEEQALEYEIYYIYSYEFEYGFKLANMTVGGDGISGFKWSDEDKEYMSEIRSGEKNPMFGVPSPMTGQGWKIAGEKNGMYGKKQSIETRKKIAELKQGSKSVTAIAVEVFENGQSRGKFGCIAEAAKTFTKDEKEFRGIANAFGAMAKGFVKKQGRWKNWSVKIIDKSEVSE